MDMTQLFAAFPQLSMMGGPQQMQTGTPQMNGGMNFQQLNTDPNAAANLQADAIKLQQNRMMAQALMQQGGQYIPGSGKAGIAAGLASLIRGKMMESGQDESLRDILQRQFKLENEAAKAKRAQELEDEQRKLMGEIFKGTEVAKGTAKAQKDYAKGEFKDGGVFDPSTNTWTADSGWTQQQMDLARQKAALERASRPGPANPYANLDIAVASGLITQEEANRRKREQLLGSGEKPTTPPSGYQWKPDGSGVQPIPGGPEDKPKEANPKLAAAAQAKSILDQMEKALDSGKTWTGPIDKYTIGEGQQQFESLTNQLVNPFQTLTRIPGAGSQSDVELKQLMSTFPSLGNREGVNKQNIANLRRYIDTQTAGLSGGEAPITSQGAAVTGAQPTATATGPNGQKVGLVNGQWVPL